MVSRTSHSQTIEDEQVTRKIRKMTASDNGNDLKRKDLTCRLYKHLVRNRKSQDRAGDLTMAPRNLSITPAFREDHSHSVDREPVYPFTMNLYAVKKQQRRVAMLLASARSEQMETLSPRQRRSIIKKKMTKLDHLPCTKLGQEDRDKYDATVNYYLKNFYEKTSSTLPKLPHESGDGTDGFSTTVSTNVNGVPRRKRHARKTKSIHRTLLDQVERLHQLKLKEDDGLTVHPATEDTMSSADGHQASLSPSRILGDFDRGLASLREPFGRTIIRASTGKPRRRIAISSHGSEYSEFGVASKSATRRNVEAKSNTTAGAESLVTPYQLVLLDAPMKLRLNRYLQQPAYTQPANMSPRSSLRLEYGSDAADEDGLNSFQSFNSLGSSRQHSIEQTISRQQSFIEGNLETPRTPDADASLQSSSVNLLQPILYNDSVLPFSEINKDHLPRLFSKKGVINSNDQESAISSLSSSTASNRTQSSSSEEMAILGNGECTCTEEKQLRTHKSCRFCYQTYYHKKWCKQKSHRLIPSCVTCGLKIIFVPSNTNGNLNKARSSIEQNVDNNLKEKVTSVTGVDEDGIENMFSPDTTELFSPGTNVTPIQSMSHTEDDLDESTSRFVFDQISPAESPELIPVSIDESLHSEAQLLVYETELTSRLSDTVRSSPVPISDLDSEGRGVDSRASTISIETVPDWTNVHRNAYLAALADTRAKAILKKPAGHGLNVSRSYVFSYFASASHSGHARRPTPPKGAHKKSILGNINIYDYYPGGKKNPNEKLPHKRIPK